MIGPRPFDESATDPEMLAAASTPSLRPRSSSGNDHASYFAAATSGDRPKCTYCGKLGHLASTCFKKETCSLCDTPGHPAKYCKVYARRKDGGGRDRRDGGAKETAGGAGGDRVETNGDGSASN